MLNLNDINFDLTKIPVYLNHAKHGNKIFIRYPCQRGCIFCFLKQHGPALNKIKQSNLNFETSFKNVLSILNYNKDIHISVGDIFNYPPIYNILKILNDELTSRNSSANFFLNSTFAEFDFKKINLFRQFKNMRANLSLMTFDTDIKNQIMAADWSKKQTEKVKKVIQFGVLSKVTIYTFGDLPALKKDLREFYNLISNTVQRKELILELAYPSATKYANKIARKMSKIAILNWDEAVKIHSEFAKLNPNIDCSIYALTDLLKYSRQIHSPHNEYAEVFRKGIENALSQITSRGKPDLSEVAFITSESCYNYAKEMFPKLNWILAEHIYWGGDITTCNLLTFKDIEVAIKRNNIYPLYIVSKGILWENNPKFDLMGNSLHSLLKRIKCEILFF